MSRLARWADRCWALGAVLAVLIAGSAAPADATSWVVPLAGGSRAQAGAGTLRAPTPVTASCGTGSNKGSVIVSWSPATNASTYTVLQSTTSASSGFSTAATGVAGTSWTSPALSNGSWWFQVVAVRSNWSGPASASTAQRTIAGNNCS